MKYGRNSGNKGVYYERLTGSHSAVWGGEMTYIISFLLGLLAFKDRNKWEVLTLIILAYFLGLVVNF